MTANCFPGCLELTHTEDDRECFVRFLRVGMPGAGRVPLLALLHKIAHRGMWPDRFNYVALLWQSEARQKGRPIGFATFCLETDCTRSGRVKEVTFTLDKIYITERLRGKRFGRMLAESFAEWFYHCKVHGSRIDCGGVKVYFNADYRSKGGRAFGQHIASHLEDIYFMQGEMKATGALGWHIKGEVEDLSESSIDEEEIEYLDRLFAETEAKRRANLVTPNKAESS
jgi:GNAT superfamily N-acetyltransferase